MQMAVWWALCRREGEREKNDNICVLVCAREAARVDTGTEKKIRERGRKRGKKSKE